MSNIKQLLGLDESKVSDSDIMERLIKAQKENIEEVDFVKEDGTVVRVRLPNFNLDPYMYTGG